MALDSSLFAAKIPAGAYAIGDSIQLGIIRGPEVVRSGYGSALLKRVFTVALNTVSAWKITVRNSNWVDETSNPGSGMTETSLGENSASIQPGHDAPLTPNSSWMVTATCVVAGTETADSMVFALIDVDYPSVAAIKNPKIEQGFPVTTDFANLPITVTAKTANPANLVWTVKNVDILKAGSKYLLSQTSFKSPNATEIGFVEISGAAGQNGLARIIPCRSQSYAGLKYYVDYSTPLVKGPMNIAIAAVGTAGADNAYLYLDWVKR